MYGWINCEDPPHLWGSYATHTFVPEHALVHSIPDALSDKEALLAGSVLANGYRWTGMAEIGLSTSVVIIGPGPQGLACTLFSELRNANDIILVGLERDASRLEKGVEFGADERVTISSDDDVDDVARQIENRLTGSAPEGVFETAGTQAAMDLAVDLVKPLGTLTHVSLTDQPRLDVPFNTLLTKEATVLNLLAHPYSVADTLKLTAHELADEFDMDSIVSHIFSLSEAETALRTAAYEYEARPLKVALEP